MPLPKGCEVEIRLAVTGPYIYIYAKNTEYQIDIDLEELHDVFATYKGNIAEPIHLGTIPDYGDASVILTGDTLEVEDIEQTGEDTSVTVKGLRKCLQTLLTTNYHKL